MPAVIKVENLSKQYRLGDVGTGTLRDDFKRWRYRIMGKEDPFLKIGEENDRRKVSESDYVWALKDINFEVEQGDVVGIIGRNGAGKSTLLKILSRTTAPTTGSVKVKGRIASLLEVGTGFHGELSGRENIYLNGAIMGLRKWEIDKKLDEIIDFAGVEKYLDTPVKRYSSGMYVRLAFAVAAHLEPDILIVDEVLAVGDAEFQKKCLGKMKDVSQGQGRTVLFVSHNMAAISQLSNSCVLLKNGKISSVGTTEKIISNYLELEDKMSFINFDFEENIIENRFISLSMIDIIGNKREEYKFNEEIGIRIKLQTAPDNKNLELALRLVDGFDRAIFTIHEQLIKHINTSNPTFFYFDIIVPSIFLTPGNYSWVFCINNPGVCLFDLKQNILPFSVVETGSDFQNYKSSDYGCVFAKYTIQKITM